MIKALATMLVANGANGLLLRPPGRGTTHSRVALALGGKALYENRAEERLTVLSEPNLLMIIAICVIPIDQEGTNLFFQLVIRRLKRGD